MIFFLIPLTKGRHVLNTLETPIREALLKPRNFNPHPYYPYDVSASALEPVQEPYSPVLDNSVFDGNLQSVPQQIPRASPANGIYRLYPCIHVFVQRGTKFNIYYHFPPAVKGQCNFHHRRSPTK